jgi:hypothetical protein
MNMVNKSLNRRAGGKNSRQRGNAVIKIQALGKLREKIQTEATTRLHGSQGASGVGAGIALHGSSAAMLQSG